eukprot:g5875.t1
MAFISLIESSAPGALLVLLCGLTGLSFAAVQLYLLSTISLDPKSYFLMLNQGDEAQTAAANPIPRMLQLYVAIRDGAKAFLAAEYKICFYFIVVVAAIVFGMLSYTGTADWDTKLGYLSAISFAVGGLTSLASGYLGMMVAVYSNVRTTKEAMNTDAAAAWKNSFNAAFRAGGVMGFALTGLALLVLFVLIHVFALGYDVTGAKLDEDGNPKKFNVVYEAGKNLFECIAGFGLGGSCIALFGRVGGGIYTKAADVGADLAGKVCHGLPEDDPRNPATIADNVGDNVGDVAGMGSDLFGSFGEATCAALVIGAACPEILCNGFSSLLFPLYISAAGIVVCVVTSFFATHINPVRKETDVEWVLKVQIGVSTLIMTLVLLPLCYAFLPEHATFGCAVTATNSFHDMCLEAASGIFSQHCSATDVVVVDHLPAYAFVAVGAGLWGGCLIGFITEYYTSASYHPVQELAQSTETGAATNIIYGLALGYKSAILPALIIASIVFAAFSMLGMYGIALAALGMLSTLATCLSIDVYGPVCDNAGGIAEMAGCPESTRDTTDALDAAGNTTAAIGKGFAIGSAALVSLALFGAFVTRASAHDRSPLASGQVNMLAPITFAFLILGAMLPYWFTAMTMKSVGEAAKEMVQEVKRQFDTLDLLNPNSECEPDYARCIGISTEASLREMVPPGILVMVTPVVVGTLFGVEALSGLLAGSLVSSVQLAISASNTGGAWDNAKKFVESGRVQMEVRQEDGSMVLEVQGKGSECHKAAVVGDTVGDPLKDTSGPALNIVMKLMAIISLVFCGWFMSINDGHGWFKIH